MQISQIPVTLRRLLLGCILVVAPLVSAQANTVTISFSSFNLLGFNGLTVDLGAARTSAAQVQEALDNGLSPGALYLTSLESLLFELPYTDPDSGLNPVFDLSDVIAPDSLIRFAEGPTVIDLDLRITDIATGAVFDCFDQPELNCRLTATWLNDPIEAAIAVAVPTGGHTSALALAIAVLVWRLRTGVNSGHRA